MENVVTAIFEVESEAYKAFTEIRNKSAGEGYSVVEASLLKRDGDNVVISDAFDAAGVTSDDTATGAVVGAILGGPLGVLLGAGTGALIGSAFDSDDAIDSASMLEVTAGKLYDGEVAIVALVQEEEPAFDAAFEGYQTTIIRHFAADVVKEVELARQSAAEYENQLREQLRAERKAQRAEKRAERKAKMEARVDSAKAKHAERKAEFDEAKDIANAQYVSSTKEMLDEE